eukprot:1847779-Rhodomonas_salina.1
MFGHGWEWQPVDLEGGRVELAIGAKVPRTHRALCVVDGQACPRIEAIEAMYQASHTFCRAGKQGT